MCRGVARSWHASYPHFAQSLYGEDVHEIDWQADVAPLVQLSRNFNNRFKLLTFCDPGSAAAWDPYQAASCKKVVGRVCISKACCTCSTPIIGLHGLMVFILRSLRRFLPTSLVWAQIDREARDVGA